MTQTLTAPPWRPQALAELEADLRESLRAILGSLSDLLDGPGHDSVRHFLADAPAEHCIRLADAWALATEMGLNPAQLKPRFTAEEQFLLELVTAIYTAGRPNSASDRSHDLGDLCDLVADLAAA